MTTGNVFHCVKFWDLISLYVGPGIIQLKNEFRKLRNSKAIEER